jgi:hypothetical protein
MTTYALSFELKKNTTYQTRYDMLMVAAKSYGRHWCDTTSFVIFETSESIDEVMAHLAAAVSATTDILFLLDLDVKAARIYGAWRDEDIFKLAPYTEICVDA